MQYVMVVGSIMDVCPDRKNLLAKWRVRFHLFFFSLSKSIARARLLGSYACHSPPLVLVWFIRSRVGVSARDICLTSRRVSMAGVSVVLTSTAIIQTRWVLEIRPHVFDFNLKNLPIWHKNCILQYRNIFDDFFLFC